VRDIELYAQLLGLTFPWFVSSVEMNIEALEVHVLLDHKQQSGFTCPECGLECAVYDHSPERVWRDLDTHRASTLIHCSLPRVRCKEHGVQTAKVPWADPHSRYTRLFEAQIIKLLGLTKCQVRTARFMGLTERQVHGVMQRAVKRGLSRRKKTPVKRLGIDEKSFHRGHVYASVLSDLDGKRVLEVKLERTLEASVELLSDGVAFPLEVECVSMDMWEAFASAVKKVFPQADVVHDRFHIAQYLNEAVDLTRRSEHAKLLRKGDWTLEKSRFLWVKNRENHTAKQAERFKSLLGADLNTAKAWALKETFKAFFQSDTVEDAEQFLNDWTQEVEKTKNRHLLKVAKMLINHKEGLLNYVKHRVTNAAAEALNSMIQEIKTIARGFRRFENFRVAILFFLGGLELNP
jgi:transposase